MGLVTIPVRPPPPYSESSPAWGGPAGQAVSVHPQSDKKGVIVKVNPPKAPADESSAHVPCDIALVIDVSSSMNAEAPVPSDPNDPDGLPEESGLSVLDLVKHSCRTILASLNEKDRLAVIKFSSRVEIIQGLEFMNDDKKKEALDNIERLKVEGMTNLWQAINAGVNVFERAHQVGNVPAIVVLTDGQPNHMCPPQGYIPALRNMGAIVPAIHTFGFGSSVRSGLLKSIAEFGGGNYAFIPDAGMIGTTFVHAVANLQSTFVINACLQLTYPGHIVLEETVGPYVKNPMASEEQTPGDGESSSRLIIPLGNIQYGQSRDIYLRCHRTSRQIVSLDFSVTLEYTPLKTIGKVTSMDTPRESRKETRLKHRSIHSLHDISSPLPEAEIAYHIARSQVCAFLASLFPIDEHEEHRTDKDLVKRYNAFKPEPLKAKQEELTELINSLPAARYPNDARCKALMQDLNGGEPYGQVTIALSNVKNLDRWGQHYLPSLHGAHARQLCSNFKDPGPLQYSSESPLFIDCRDRLSKAFDDLPPPEPSLSITNWEANPSQYRAPGPPRPSTDYSAFVMDPLYRTRGMPPPPPSSTAAATPSNRSSRSLYMSSYNMSSNPCFAGQTMVQLASGTRIPLHSLQGGMQVATPLGPRSVAKVLVTPVKNESMVNLGGVLVTPWHPVTLVTDASTSSSWQFPCLVADDVEMEQYSGYIYSVLLQRDHNVDAHAVLLGASAAALDRRCTQGGAPSSSSSTSTSTLWGVTLGHGLVAGSDVRAHRFFGDYARVWDSLLGLGSMGGEEAATAPASEGCVLTGGVVKKSGLVSGFKRAPDPLTTDPFSVWQTPFYHHLGGLHHPPPPHDLSSLVSS